MKRYFCDICGRELPGDFFVNADITFGRTSFRYEMCNKCFDRLTCSDISDYPQRIETAEECFRKLLNKKYDPYENDPVDTDLFKVADGKED